MSAVADLSAIPGSEPVLAADAGRANPYGAPAAYAPGQRKLRVLMISHTCQSRTEGQPKAHALARLPEIDLHLLTPARWKHYGKWRDAEAPVGANFQCTIAPVRFAWMGPAQYFMHYYPGLGRILKTFKPDVIDLWEEAWGLVSAHACYLRNRICRGAKIVAETEQNISKVLPLPFEKFRAYTLRHADYAVSRNVEGISVIREKGYMGPVEVVPNAVDTELFRPLDRAACRRALGMEGFVVGYIGRLVREKGVMDLVEAVAMCPEEVRLVMVGSGPMEGDILRRAAELSVGHRVRILPGRPLEQIPEVMNALDVFVLPSHTTGRWKEQFGRVLIEAGACGVPVIGSDSAAIPDVIGEAGLVFKEQNVPALSAAIETLRENPERGWLMGAEGRRQAKAIYTWDAVARRMAGIYQKAADSTAG